MRRLVGMFPPQHDSIKGGRMKLSARGDLLQESTSFDFLEQGVIYHLLWFCLFCPGIGFGDSVEEKFHPFEVDVRGWIDFRHVVIISGLDHIAVRYPQMPLENF